VRFDFVWCTQEWNFTSSPKDSLFHIITFLVYLCKGFLPDSSDSPFTFVTVVIYIGLVPNSMEFVHVIWATVTVHTATRTSYFGYRSHILLAIETLIFQTSHLAAFCILFVTHNKNFCMSVRKLLFLKLLERGIDKACNWYLYIWS
jgi:hypothetical protein